MAIKETAQLKKLAFQKQIAFAYLTCERVYPHCVYFSNNYNFGDLGILRSAIDFVYSALFSSVDSQKIDDLLKQVDSNIPYPEKFTTFYASIAMYSSGVIYESVNLLKRTDVPRILDDLSTLCTDAVDLFIQVRDEIDYEEPDFETKILNDTLMQRELSIQKGIISYLSKVGPLTSSDIDTLLQLQQEGTGTLIL